MTVKRITRPTDLNPQHRLLYAIAITKLLKAAMLLLISAGAFRLLHGDVEATLTGWFEEFRLDPHNHFLHHMLAAVVGMSPHRLQAMGVGTMIYAGLFIAEGVGLLMRKRWAEYMTVITTALLLPVEGYELFRHPSMVKVVVLVINAAIVAYLAVRLKRGSGAVGV